MTIPDTRHKLFAVFTSVRQKRGYAYTWTNQWTDGPTDKPMDGHTILQSRGLQLTSLYEQRCGFSMQFSFQYFFHFMDDTYHLLDFAIDCAIFTMWLQLCGWTNGQTDGQNDGQTDKIMGVQTIEWVDMQ